MTNLMQDLLSSQTILTSEIAAYFGLELDGLVAGNTSTPDEASRAWLALVAFEFVAPPGDDGMAERAMERYERACEYALDMERGAAW